MRLNTRPRSTGRSGRGRHHATLVGDKRTYQMDPGTAYEPGEVPSTSRKAPTWVMVKPGLPYLDIVARVKETFAVPTFAYLCPANTR